MAHLPEGVQARLEKWSEEVEEPVRRELWVLLRSRLTGKVVRMVPVDRSEVPS